MAWIMGCCRGEGRERDVALRTWCDRIRRDRFITRDAIGFSRNRGECEEREREWNRME